MSPWDAPHELCLSLALAALSLSAAMILFAWRRSLVTRLRDTTRRDS
ncbi:MAG: hypothetical protein U0836_04825 [Pirellulales bacterium]